jgi:SnoaL-like domain
MNGDREGAPSPPEDWNALRNLVMNYCRGIDRRDMGLLQSIFHPDAQLDFGAGYFVGPLDTWLANVPSALEQFAATQHHVTNSLFRSAETTAVGETYLIAYHVLRSPGAGLYVAGARYLDRFERRQNEWRIIHRTAVQDWQSPDGKLEGLNLGKLDRSDLSYRLFGR